MFIIGMILNDPLHDMIMYRKREFQYNTYVDEEPILTLYLHTIFSMVGTDDII